jgi:hypothetical protein
MIQYFKDHLVIDQILCFFQHLQSYVHVFTFLNWIGSYGISYCLWHCSNINTFVIKTTIFNLRGW